MFFLCLTFTVDWHVVVVFHMNGRGGGGVTGTLTNAFHRVRRLCVRPFFNDLFCITPPHRRTHATFGGFVSVCGGWMVLCRGLVMAEDSPHVTVQCNRTF